MKDRVLMLKTAGYEKIADELRLYGFDCDLKEEDENSIKDGYDVLIFEPVVFKHREEECVRLLGLFKRNNPKSLVIAYTVASNENRDYAHFGLIDHWFLKRVSYIDENLLRTLVVNY